MSDQRLRVGIIGVQPGRSWAARSHIPALQKLSEIFEIVGIANSSRASAEIAAAETGIARAFDSTAELIAAPEIDIVTVAVKVPLHLELVKAAIAAGKHVYCEWPLGNGLPQAERMATLARAKGIVGVVGTQAPFAPEMQYLKHLIEDGFIGELVSTTIVARGGALQGSGKIPDSKTYGYLLDRANGATMLTIPVGHTLSALTSVLGPVSAVSAVLATRRPTARVLDTGQVLPVTAPDQVLVSGVLTNDALLSLHFRGGAPRDDAGLFWEINGTEGDIRISGPSGHMQMVPLSLEGAQGDEKAFRTLNIPQSYRIGWPADEEAGNVARVYAAMARDLRHCTRTTPRFEDAVVLHRIIDVIERSAQSHRCLLI